MITYITFAVETLVEGQKIISAVNALDIKPHKMFYELPVAGQLKEDKAETVDRLVPRREKSYHFDSPVPGIDMDKPFTFEDQGVAHPDRPNVSPGPSLIGKIGENAKLFITNWLRESPNLPMAAKYNEHLKLLWKRGEVKYDGERYYL